MKIVLVESAHHVRDGLALHLREQGHEVIAYARGRAALGQIACYQADLVVVGETLIDMDGAAVAAHLRHWSANPTLPVLVVRSAESVRLIRPVTNLVKSDRPSLQLPNSANCRPIA